MEAFITAVHGNPRQVILAMIRDGMTYKAIAEALSTPYYSVTQQWVSRWVANNIELKAVLRDD